MLASAGLAALTFAIVQGETAGWILSAILLPAFALVQRVNVRRGAPAILDPVLTRVRSFTLGSAALLIIGAGEFGLMFLLPLELQSGKGLTAIEAGLVQLPVAVFAMVAFPLVQELAARTDERTAVVVGLLLEAVGLVGVGIAIQSSQALLIVPGLAVYGLGVGAATAQLSALVLAEVPASRNGLASGISSAVRQLGSTMGVGVLGVVFSATLATPTATSPTGRSRPCRTCGRSVTSMRCRVRPTRCRAACSSPRWSPRRSWSPARWRSASSRTRTTMRRRPLRVGPPWATDLAAPGNAGGRR